MNRNASHKGPGQAERKGLSLVQITRMFPSDEAAEALFVRDPLAGRYPLPALRL